MLSNRTLKLTSLALVISTAITGCATVDNFAADNNSFVVCGAGAAAGAALSAIVATALKKDAGDAAIGGALAGCLAGVAYKARVDSLREIARREGLKMQVNTIEVVTSPTSKSEAGLKASVESGSMFDVGSATLTIDGQRQVRAMAEVIADNRGKAANAYGNGQAQQQRTPKKILVVGHTDSTGSAQSNMVLSEKRARAVASILSEAGIPASDIYFQGAGASRPIADNTLAVGRDKNRRVEITEVADQKVLMRLIAEDRNNPRYLAHGTSTAVKVSSVSQANKKAAQQSDSTVKAPVVQAPAVRPQEAAGQVAQAAGASTTAPARPAESQVSVSALPRDKALKIAGSGSIDFGGQLVRTTTSTLAQGLTPKPTSFSLIDSANASNPVTSCLADMPRTAGEIKSLATGTTVSEFKTNEYMVGMNGRAWAGMVNGHQAAIGPVAILKDGAKVAQEPEFQATMNVKSGAPKETPLYKAVANTYEGDGEVLYRVFAVNANKTPVSCLDIVFDTRNGVAKAGELFYSKGGDAFVADFIPVRR